MNEYYDKFQELQERGTFKGQQWFGERSKLVEKYSWAVPNRHALLYLSEFDHLIEVGAGNGYWAHCIEEYGGNVRATDIDPPDDTWHSVEQVDAKFIDMKDNAILTVWPPYDDEMASLIPKKDAAHILYVGESKNGCTGSDTFFRELDETYGLVAKVDIPSYEGIHDNLYHYVRKV